MADNLTIQRIPRGPDLWVTPITLRDFVGLGPNTIQPGTYWPDQLITAIHTDFPWITVTPSDPPGTRPAVFGLGCSVSGWGGQSWSGDPDDILTICAALGVPESQALGTMTDGLQPFRRAGIWASTTLTDGWASRKTQWPQLETRDSHDRARDRRRVVLYEERHADIRYEFVPGCYVYADLCHLPTWSLRYGFAIGDESVSFEPIWRHLTGGGVARIVPDTYAVPTTMNATNSQDLVLSGSPNMPDIARLRVSAGEFYDLTFGVIGI